MGTLTLFLSRKDNVLGSLLADTFISRSVMSPIYGHRVRRMPSMAWDGLGQNRYFPLLCLEYK